MADGVYTRIDHPTQAAIPQKAVDLGDGTFALAASVQGAVTGPLTDAELRATPVPVSGPLTDAELRATDVPVSGPLTDTELRATAVPVSGPLTDTELRATAVPVSGPLTDAELRATDVPVALARVGYSAQPRATITRPADTTQYAVGDALSDATVAPTVPTVAAGRANGGSGMLVSLRVVDGANQATKAAFQVLLFDTTFTALEDNAAMDMADAEVARHVATFEVETGDWVVTNAGAGAAGNCVAQVAPEGNGYPGFTCLAGSQNLYMAVRLTNTYTPVSGEVFTFIFDVQQD